jgi:hypothetical protein
MPILPDFFQQHNAEELFGSRTPSTEQLGDFLAEMTSEEVQEMLEETYGQGIQA